MKSAESTIARESSATSVVEQNEHPAPEEEIPSVPFEECPATPAQEETPSSVQERPHTAVEECSATPAQERPPIPTQDRSSTPVQETVDEDYLPDYEYASPMRVTDNNPMDDADILVERHILENHAEDGEYQVETLMTGSTIPSLEDSMDQLSIQNEYKLAAEDEDELNHDTPPLRTPMVSRVVDLHELHDSTGTEAVDALHTYTPQHNITESADLCIPDYDVGTVFGVVIPTQQDDAGAIGQELVEDEQVSTHGSSEESSNAAQRFEALFQEMATESASTEIATITDILIRAPDLGPNRTGMPIEADQALSNDLESSEGLLHSAHINEVSQDSAPDAPQVSATSEAPTSQTSQVKQRSIIAALHTPPRPVKSTKAATKSTFQLPGEAIAAKLKAQREERQKKEQSNQAQGIRKDPLARPALKSIRTTGSIMTTSQARSSVKSDTIKSGSSTMNSRPTIDRTARPSMPARGVSTTVRTMYPSRPPHIGASTLTTRTKPSAATTDTLQKSAPVLPRPANPRTSTAPLRPSLDSRKSTAPAQPSVADSAGPRVHATGADVFNRPMIRRAIEEKAAKEKVEAQKRARAEAAERSRQMSREFAERKKGITGGKVGNGAGSRNVSEKSQEVAMAEVVKVDGGAGVAMEGAVEAS